MAQDDYHVIIFQILAYLYQCLKKGIPVEEKNLTNDSKYMNINPEYWTFIMLHLAKSGYIEGLTISKVWGQEAIISNLDRCRITPEGIEYLTDNNFMKRVGKYIEDAAKSAELLIKLAPFVINEVTKHM